MYIPGYHNTLGHSSHQAAHSNYSLGPAPMRARSTTPTGGGLEPGVNGVPSGHAAAAVGINSRMAYNDLQFPVTSNYGSMKKRSQRSTTNTNSTTVLSSAGEPSPTASGAALAGGVMIGGDDDPAGMGGMGPPISLSVDNVHRYVPDYLAVSNRKTAV